MKIIELDNPRPISGEITEDGEVIINFQDLDGTYKTEDEGFDHNILVKKLTVVSNDYNIPQNMGYVVPKENLSDGCTFGEMTLSKDQLNELINSKTPAQFLYDLNPNVMEAPLLDYYEEYLKEDDFDEFESIYGSEEDPLEDLANKYGRDSDEYIDAASKKELIDDEKFEQEKQEKLQAAINDETLNAQIITSLNNNEDVCIVGECIIEQPWEDDEEEVGALTDEGLDFIAKTYSFDLIQEEDGTWGIKDTAVEGQAVSSSLEEVKDIEIVGIEEQFDDDGLDYEDIYSEPINDYEDFEESKNDTFKKIYKNSKLREKSLKENTDTDHYECGIAKLIDRNSEFDEGYWDYIDHANKRYNEKPTDPTKSSAHWEGWELAEEEFSKGYDDYMDWVSKPHGEEEPTDPNMADAYLKGWEIAKQERQEQMMNFISNLKESDESWYEEIYERERDGDYETPAECCNCGADCHDNGEIINGDVYCPSCAEHERNK